MKKLWLILNSFLLIVSSIAWITGSDNLFGICITLIILLSFPLNLLVGWLFFAFASLGELPGMMLLMALIMSGVGYIQWFKLVPRIAKFFSSKVSQHDVRIEVQVKRKYPQQLEEGDSRSARDWGRDAFDKEKYSPVERVFSQETE